jgi:predicted 2-oxoglutarate/Fe(II)-dependent dioxygenase YbiX
MVSNKNDYTGGDFQIVNKGGEVVSRNASKRGGVLFDSNKDHGVTPIITGSRVVIAVEFWPFYDTNIDDKRPREVDYADRIKIPQLLEVEVENNQKSCSAK